MAGDREGHEMIFNTAREAWQASGRADKPYLIGSFWYSLSPHAKDDLQAYVYDYMKFADDGFARSFAQSMTRYTPDAIREGIENLRAAGADEVLLVPATAHANEIDGIVDLLG